MKASDYATLPPAALAAINAHLSDPAHPYNSEPVPKVWPGAGWRFVKVGETLEAGDEVVFGGGLGPQPLSIHFGSPVMGGDGNFPHGFYRRRIEPRDPAQTRISPGPGFRFLHPEETLIAGDGYVFRGNIVSIATTNVGKVSRNSSFCFVRRLPLLPPGTPPTGYRFLAHGEQIAPGEDRFIMSGAFFETSPLHGWRARAVDYSGGPMSDNIHTPFIRSLSYKSAPRPEIPHGYVELKAGDTIRRTDLYLHAADKTWRLRSGTKRCGAAYAPFSSPHPVHASVTASPHSLTIRREWAVEPKSFPRFKSPEGIVYHDAPGTALRFTADDDAEHGPAVVVHQVADDPVAAPAWHPVVIPQAEVQVFCRALWAAQPQLEASS